MKFIIILISILLFPTMVLAQELQANFQDWSVFRFERGDKTLCYITSIPIKRKGSYSKNNGEPFFLVTNIKNDADEISVSSGFYYKEKSNVELSFGSHKFYLFPHRAMAWANDKNEDINIIKAMQKHDDMVVSGISAAGKIFSDTYSLIGFSKSYLKMKQICNK